MSCRGDKTLTAREAVVPSSTTCSERKAAHARHQKLLHHVSYILYNKKRCNAQSDNETKMNGGNNRKRHSSRLENRSRVEQL